MTRHYKLAEHVAVQDKAPEPHSETPGATQAPDSSWSERGTYDGAELRPFEGRPGAMDAYALPSRGSGD